MAERVDWQVLIDRETARQVAARVAPAGVPVSMREAADAPGTWIGTGHWRRHVERLTETVERAAVAIAQVPPGGVRDQLDGVMEILGLRLQRYTHIAEVGQALWPDDDTTDLDGTVPGMAPRLSGVAQEIDDRLSGALAHLTAVAVSIEHIGMADTGQRDPDTVSQLVARVLEQVPAP